jgi:glycosyltransferase involved in cell wall biosynthesis
MVRGLTAAGIEVDVATTDDDDDRRTSVPLEQPTRRAGGTFYYFPRQARFYTLSLPLRRWLRKHARDYSVVHTHAAFSFAGTVAARAARRAGRPYIVRPLGTLAPYGLRQHPILKQVSLSMIERRLLDRAAAIQCTSKLEAEEIRRLNPNWYTRVIPLGVDLSTYTTHHHRDWIQQRAPQLTDRKILLFLSRIHPKKGIKLLLQALATARKREPAIALVIAGTGQTDYVTALQDEARMLQLQDDIFWAGQLDEREKREALAAADALVLPSQAENFGMAVVEALACGLPVIISDQVGIHHEIQEAGAGVVVPLDRGHWSAAMVSLLQDNDARERMRTRARELAVREYSADNMTARLIYLYRSLEL